MRPWIGTLALIFILAIASPISSVQAAGVGVTAPGHTDAVSASADTFLFFPRRPGGASTLGWRDLEFSLSANYSRNRGDATPGLTANDNTTLAKFAATLTDSIANPFRAQYSDLWLIYDYFSTTGARYDDNLLSTHSFQLPSSASSNIVDRQHLDHYIHEPGLDGFYNGMYPSVFGWQKEDSSTGHWTSSTNWTVYNDNATSFRGPALSAIQDLSGSGWTKPDGDANWGTIHEFNHNFNRDTNKRPMTEIFSTAAEVLSGGASTALTQFDVSYTWSLLAEDAPLLDPAGPEGWGPNYTAWRLLSAYILFNFLNADTSKTLNGATIGGMNDDLMYRWAHSAASNRNLSKLQDRLTNDSCYTCSQKADFTSLCKEDRLNVLLHNWRTANFVNDAFLKPDADGHGMYGYPPQYGFSPTQDVGAWRDNDTAPGADNVIVFPAEVTARPAWASSDTVIATTRSRDAVSYPLLLQPLGAEYWVVRSTSGIPGTTDLVVRATADSLHRKPAYSSVCQFLSPQDIEDGRFLVSLVGYSQQADDLWNHPEWADTVIGPRWVDIDSLAGGIEFVLPGFGGRFRAAVLVLSSGVGPRGTLASLNTLGGSYHESTRYRLNLALRQAPYASQNPAALVSASHIEDHPSWSPDGTELVYCASTSPYTQIYRKSVGGGSATSLVSRSYHQQTPDWSPRGDFVAFAEAPSAGTSRIALYRLADGNFQFVSATGYEDLHPAFQPNGRRIAYARRNTSNGQWSIRRVSIDGTGDVELTTSSLSSAVTAVRWSPDGSTVYFASGRRLYSIPAAGGAPLAHDAVAKSVGAFDLATGSGRMVLEEVDSLAYYCGTPKEYERFRRLSLRDTTVTPRDTEMRFYRTGASFYSPRYSPDNRYIAYRTDENSVGSGDLYLGQVIYDHAPVLNAEVKDTTVGKGIGLTMNLSSTDPDGDTVTYSGTYLPSGSSISGSNFYWNNPDTTGGPFYVVLRAHSPGGAVASKVIRIDVVPRPLAVTDLVATGGRFAMVMSWSEPTQTGGNADEYEIRYMTNTAITENNFHTGALWTYGTAPGAGGTLHCSENDATSCVTYSIAIRSKRNGIPSVISNVATENTLCTGSLIPFCEWDGLMGGGGGGGALRTGGIQTSSAGPETVQSQSSSNENSLLGGTDGPSRVDAVRIAADPVDGVYHIGLRQSAPVVAELDEVRMIAVDHDLDTEIVAGMETLYAGVRVPVTGITDAQGASIVAGADSPFAATADETLTVDLGPDTQNAALLVAASRPRVQIAAGTAGIVVERRNEDGSWQTVEKFHPRRSADPYAIETLGAREFRLSFGSRCEVEAIARLNIQSRPSPSPLELQGANHGESGDARQALEQQDENSTTLQQGEELALEFAAPVATAAHRTLYLLTRGTQRRVEPLSATTQSSAVDSRPPVFAFALGPARPNPTTGRVMIEYSLPHQTHVSLRVYDAAGRLVRRLVDEQRSTGLHEVVWDGTSKGGAKVSPGVYFYKLQAGHWSSQRKLIVLQR